MIQIKIVYNIKQIVREPKFILNPCLSNNDAESASQRFLTRFKTKDKRAWDAVKIKNLINDWTLRGPMQLPIQPQ